MKELYQLLEMRRPAMRDHARGDGVLEDKIPSDDPRKELAERGVRICVRRPGHRRHRRELRVAERREHARKPRDDERQDQCRARFVVRGLSREDEDAGADDSADAERRQLHRAEDAPEALLAFHFLQQQLERFGLEKMTCHCANYTLPTADNRSRYSRTRARGSPPRSRSLMIAIASAPARTTSAARSSVMPPMATTCRPRACARTAACSTIARPIASYPVAFDAVPKTGPIAM